MSLRDIGPWLLENDAFTVQLEALTASAVAEELGNRFQRVEGVTDGHLDWGYLLLCASFLCNSDIGDCQAAALRIAQTCLTSGSSNAAQKDSAALILDSLANHPAISLAVSRGLLPPGVEHRLPLPARIEWTRRSLEFVLTLGDRSVRVNRFQKRFWDAAHSTDCLSVSAPTSAGKSYILTEWLVGLLGSKPTGLVIYIVPTRALISQVERDLRTAFSRAGMPNGEVVSTPVRSYIKEDARTALVFTQERLHVLLAADPTLFVDALIVDEAHKIADSNRGVLLQQVIEEIAENNEGLKVVFASPMSKNPEILIDEVSKETTASSLISDDVTVNQNLIWVSQVPRDPITWKAGLCLPTRMVDLGKFKLPASPVPMSKRLPFVAASLGAESYGNVVYVNGAADAEKAATQLYDLLTDIEPSKALADLIALCIDIVHPEFLLPKVLRRGIAFHYGNLPLILREEIERLFSLGEIRFLICTSTLVEGVNMACRNIFIRGPKRGKNHPMSQEDFWNLAGRAGRWGKEFQGNIVCVDASEEDVWGSTGAPKTKEKYTIRRATDASIEQIDELIDYINRGAPPELKTTPLKFEATFSYLCNRQAKYGSLASSRWAKRFPLDVVERLDTTVSGALRTIQTPAWVIQRNPGISPFAMDLLLSEFRTRTRPLDDLVPSSPGSSDAVESYVSIFGRCARTISPSIGTHPLRQFSLALLVAHWMRGYPLSRLIVDRMNALRRKQAQFSVAAVIRGVMEDVEQIARFQAPRVMACYRDLLHTVLLEKGREDLISTYPDLSLFLEYGVAQGTQISLISLGLSRTATIALSEMIAADALTKDEVLQWLQTNARLWRESSLSPLVKREVESLMPPPTANDESAAEAAL